MEPLTVARIFIASVMLTGAAISDIQTRRVRNKYWIPFLVIAAGFILSDLVGDWQGTWLAIAVAVGSLFVFYALWLVGLLFGGADAKAMMVLALLVPHTATAAEWTLTPAVDALFNGTIATLVLPIGMLAVNVARGRWAGAATLLAVPVKIADAKGRYVWPLERVEDGRVVRRMWQKRTDDLDVIYAQLEEAGVDTVWATPKIPFLVPVLIGWVAAVFFGNVMLSLVALVLL